MDDVAFSSLILFAWIAVGALVGYNIGKPKGRGSEGALLGAFFGFIGWIIVLLLPEGGGVKCPECFGAVPAGARKCKHCGGEIKQRVAPSAVRRGPTMEQVTFTKCSCRQCGGSIEFDLTQFDRRNPATIDCPHCGQPTTLFVNR